MAIYDITQNDITSDEEKFLIVKNELDKAYTDLHDINKMVKQKCSYNSISNRCYYALFHTIQALFRLDNIRVYKHRKSLGEFNKIYVYEKGYFPNSYTENLHKALRLREFGDYGSKLKETEHSISAYKENIKFTRIFFREIKSYIEKQLNKEIQPDYLPEWGEGTTRYK